MAKNLTEEQVKRLEITEEALLETQQKWWAEYRTAIANNEPTTRREAHEHVLMTRFQWILVKMAQLTLGVLIAFTWTDEHGTRHWVDDVEKIPGNVEIYQEVEVGPLAGYEKLTVDRSQTSDTTEEVAE